jgi:hypothetical protein
MTSEYTGLIAHLRDVGEPTAAQTIADLIARVEAAERKPRKLRKVAPADASSADTSSMTNAELFAYYKRTAPVEDLLFYARTVADAGWARRFAELATELERTGGSVASRKATAWTLINEYKDQTSPWRGRPAASFDEFAAHWRSMELRLIDERKAASADHTGTSYNKGTDQCQPT